MTASSSICRWAGCRTFLGLKPKKGSQSPQPGPVGAGDFKRCESYSRRAGRKRLEEPAALGRTRQFINPPMRLEVGGETKVCRRTARAAAQGQSSSLRYGQARDSNTATAVLPHNLVPQTSLQSNQRGVGD